MENRRPVYGAGGPMGSPKPPYYQPPDQGASYIKPVRWPLAIGAAILALGAFAAIVVASARSSSLAGVSATIEDAHQRDQKTDVRTQPWGAPELALEDHRAVVSAVTPALRAATRYCNAVQADGPTDVKLTVSREGVLGATLQSGPLAGTKAGQCVASRLVGTKVPGFDAATSTVVEPIGP